MNVWEDDVPVCRTAGVEAFSPAPKAQSLARRKRWNEEDREEIVEAAGKAGTHEPFYKKLD